MAITEPLEPPLGALEVDDRLAILHRRRRSETLREWLSLAALLALAVWILVLMAFGFTH